MYKYFFRYDHVPQLKHEITFEEYIEKYTDKDLYKTTPVDDETRAALADFFSLDRLCDTPVRFAWLYRRNLARFYPIYKDELAIWEERKTREWFFDLYKTEHREHDGTFTLDEETKAQIARELSRTITDALTGNATETGKSNGTTGRTTDTTGGTTDSATDNGTNKQRAFSFQYPEANYQGGVIPYNLDNNPDVEFINTQSDSIGKDSSTHEGEGTSESHTKDDGTSTNAFENETNTKTDSTNITAEKSGDGSNATRGQETTTHWTEDVRREGKDLIDLANELISQLPSTDFFKRFTDKMSRCFQHDYLSDEIDEQEGYYNEL